MSTPEQDSGEALFYDLSGLGHPPPAHAGEDSSRDGAFERERAAFEDNYRNVLDLTMAEDAWKRPKYAHSHVDALFCGWMARASLVEVAAPSASAPVEGEDARLDAGAFQETIKEMEKAHAYAVQRLQGEVERLRGVLKEARNGIHFILPLAQKWADGKRESHIDHESVRDAKEAADQIDAALAGRGGDGSDTTTIIDGKKYQ